MTTSIEKIIGQEEIPSCIARVRNLVGRWMQLNYLEKWEDIIAPYEYNEVDDGCSFDVRNGATKIVLVPNDWNYVIKIPYIGDETYDDFIAFHEGDYCAQEAYYYSDAEICGCAQFFVPMVHLITVNGVPVYIQSKISAIRTAEPSGLDTFNYASIRNSEYLDPDVGGRLIKYYTSKEIEIFLAFIKKHRINDLESFRNGEYVQSFGRYVFWDYSGYHEKEMGYDDEADF